MKHPLITAFALSAAVGLALAAQTPAAFAQGENPPKVVKQSRAGGTLEPRELPRSTTGDWHRNWGF